MRLIEERKALHEPHNHCRLWRASLALAVSISIPFTGYAQSPLPTDLTNATLEDLLNAPVTSVSKKDQALFKAAAAVFVISQDDIRHSGAANIPDLLRMVPGLNVARVDANTWAISIRGFNTRYSDKVLVLIDGRSVYTPSFSGVYWDQQDVLSSRTSSGSGSHPWTWRNSLGANAP